VHNNRPAVSENIFFSFRAAILVAMRLFILMKIGVKECVRVE